MNPGDDPRPIGDYVDAAMRELNRPKLVHLDRSDTLTFRAAPEYELDAREFDTKRGLLRWLWHLTVSGKRWFTRDCLVDLLATLIGREDRRRDGTARKPRK